MPTFLGKEGHFKHLREIFWIVKTYLDGIDCNVSWIDGSISISSLMKVALWKRANKETMLKHQSVILIFYCYTSLRLISNVFWVFQQIHGFYWDAISFHYQFCSISEGERCYDWNRKRVSGQLRRTMLWRCHKRMGFPSCHRWRY